MIDVNEEKPFSFSTISKRHPIHPSVPTLWRWALHGLQGIQLETVKIGGRRYTSFEAIDRFSARLTGLRSPEGPNASVRRQQEMARAAEQTEAVFGGRARPQTCPKQEEPALVPITGRRTGGTP